jgi:hypothetical protein
MVALLHKADAWRSVLLTLTDGVELFKPRAEHKTRSSFYLVAKGFSPEYEEAVEAVREWKARWRMATFGVGGSEDVLDEGELEVLGSGGEEKVKVVLQEFGPRLVRLVEPVFGIQAEALKKAPCVEVDGGEQSVLLA